jgi:predicted transposase/invertase (TIGR01784 family)
MAKSDVNLEAQIKNEYNIRKRSPFYWAKKYVENLGAGYDYDELIPVIAINIIEFGEYPVDDFHLSFHWWEDEHKDLLMSDVCEIHFLDMVKFRRFRKQSKLFTLDDPLHRWLVYFDEHSSKEQIREVVLMDTAIAAFQNKMDAIARDPALKRTYDAYDKAESDWVTSMNTARKQGWQARQKEIDDLQAEIAKLRRRLGGK